MDKAGPIARNVEDASLVLDLIAGPDQKDLDAIPNSYLSSRPKSFKDLRIGVLEDAFHQASPQDKQVLKDLESLGAQLIPTQVPRPDPRLRLILNTEAACAFDEITRNGKIRDLVSQGRGAWPRSFRAARFIPAVDYVMASRLRTQLKHDMARAMEPIDVLVTTSYGAGILMTTNMTGHPCIVMPKGFNQRNQPRSISFIGHPFDERNLAVAASTWQNATSHHTKRPDF